ncbi:MAG: hypothetical protein AAGL68_11805 [Pseudomonadota bacterium]
MVKVRIRAGPGASAEAVPIQADIRTWRVTGHDTGSSTAVILRLVPNAMASWLRSDAAWVY